MKTNNTHMSSGQSSNSDQVPNTPGTRSLPKGYGPPRDEFRAQATDILSNCLQLSTSLLLSLYKEAKTFEQRLKVVEATGRLSERFGRYSGYQWQPIEFDEAEKIVIDYGSMTIEERKEFIRMLD